ncbi:hypothetical protein BG011_003132 [Mortierella polycephala]|uniref:RING-type domain-containing protein n=1 Tax=Mortierella polycephala TaxID=41804 RepID=A0A9P6QHM5_9FUNG|nr:hypothetical protein BG011_003132 [Mortierella polycephala]
MSNSHFSFTTASKEPASHRKKVSRLPRPKCFCGYEATAIYPDPLLDKYSSAYLAANNIIPQSLHYGTTAATTTSVHNPYSPTTPWTSRRQPSDLGSITSPSEYASPHSGSRSTGRTAAATASSVLKTNWVYECHFTPKQEGMVAPDWCFVCQEDRAEAEIWKRSGRNGNVKRTRTRTHSYNPAHDHNHNHKHNHNHNHNHIHSHSHNYNHNHRGVDLPDTDPWKGQWIANSIISQEIESHIRPANDHHSLGSISIGAELLPSESSSKSNNNVDTDVWGIEDRAESAPRSLSAGRRKPRSRWKPAFTSDLSSLDDPFFSPPNSGFATLPSTREPGLSSSRVSSWQEEEAPQERELFLDRSPSPTPPVKVCGFHMHALEWHNMQSLDALSKIALAECAQCPVFNLSLTRWLDNGMNHLRLEPFNDVTCFCGDPMVISTELRHVSPKKERYDFVCRNRSPFIGRFDPNRPRKLESCSAVIPLNNVKYLARTEPVHRSIENDQWIDRLFGVRYPNELYYIKMSDTTGLKSAMKNLRFPDYSTPQSSTRYLWSKNVSFDDKVQYIAGKFSGESGSSSSSDGEADSTLLNEWPLPEWCDDQIAKRILDDSLFNAWDETCMRHLDAFGVHELPQNLLEFSVNKACKDMESFLGREEASLKAKIESLQDQEEGRQQEFKAAQTEHASVLASIADMERSALNMPRIKCRVCYEGILTHAIVPCFHLCTCLECASQLKECVMCRGPKTGVQRIYWG